MRRWHRICSGRLPAASLPSAVSVLAHTPPDLMMIRRPVVALLALLAISLPCASQAQNIVLNGSFEAPTFADGFVLTETPPTGWTGTSFEFWTNSGAYDGLTFLEMDAYSNTSIFQTLITSPGQSYTLSFAAANRPGIEWGAIEAYWNNVLAFATGPMTSTGWQVFSTTVTATGESTTLELRAAGPSDAWGDWLDDVSVTSSTPEPSSLVLFATALGGVIAARRRLRRVS